MDSDPSGYKKNVFNQGNHKDAIGTYKLSVKPFSYTKYCWEPSRRFLDKWKRE